MRTTLTRLAVAALADGQIHALATSKARAQAAPDLIAAATRAIYRAQHLIHSDPQATVDAVLASGVKEFDRKLVEKIAAIYSPAVPATPPYRSPASSAMPSSTRRSRASPTSAASRRWISSRRRLPPTR